MTATETGGLRLSVPTGMMVDVPTDPATVLPLVGRAAELDQLAQLIGTDPRDPRAAAILLAGEAGVGKTRLLSELRDRVRAAGWRVLVGHCLDFGDSALPYLPFTEVFGRLAQEDSTLTKALAEAHPAVQRLLPDRRLLSGGDQGQTETMERGDLFEAVHAAFERLGADEPLLVIVEDSHWADQSSRELLSFLFARGFTAPVSILTSYRSDDLHRRHPLRTTAAEWARLAGVRRIQLQPLSDPDVRTLVHTLHPAALREADVHAIVGRAEGNPFFAEELVVATGRGGHDLPDDLADLLLVRVDQLHDDARPVVRAASAAGRSVTHALLSEVVDLRSADLEAALRAAVEAHVLVSLDDERYAFRHALLAEAVYDDLLPGERVRLHGAYTAALLSHQVDGTAAELARHARASHDRSTAVRASMEAGDEALMVAGPDEAAHHFQVALELLAEDAGLGDSEAPVDLIGLTIRASEAVTSAGNPHRAVALVQEQLAQLGADAAPDDRARLLIALASTALLADTSVDILATTTEAFNLIPSDAATPLRAHALGVHAQANADRQRDDDAVRWANKARDLGAQLGLTTVVADATTTLGRLDERAGDPAASARVFAEVVAQARANGDVSGELRGLHHLAGLHFEAARLGDATRAYDVAARRAVETGRPWAPFGFDARLGGSLTAYISGDWDQAQQIADATGQSPPGMAEACLAAARLLVSAGRGDAAALQLMPHIRAWWDRDGLIAILSGAAAIDLHGDGGDLPAAIVMHDDVVTSVSELWQRRAFQARVRLSGLLLGQLASHAATVSEADRGDLLARASELVAAAGEAAEIMSGRKRPMGPEGIAWVARVRAEHARLRWVTGIDAPPQDQLIAAWERAVTTFDAFGHVFETARSRARLAAVLRAAGHTTEARASADLARAAARQLGAEPLLVELRGLGSAGGNRRPAPPGGAEPLTPREHEVLALVAQGRSNGEIGRQLYISAKTVSVHVSNILAKLGVGGRTEAAAVARRAGLLD